MGAASADIGTIQSVFIDQTLNYVSLYNVYEAKQTPLLSVCVYIIYRHTNTQRTYVLQFLMGYF